MKNDGIRGSSHLESSDLLRCKEWQTQKCSSQGGRLQSDEDHKNYYFIGGRKCTKPRATEIHMAIISWQSSR